MRTRGLAAVPRSVMRGGGIRTGGAGDPFREQGGVGGVEGLPLADIGCAKGSGGSASAAITGTNRLTQRSRSGGSQKCRM